MLKVSWEQYLIAVLICTVIYYAYVIMRYFRPEVKRLFSGKTSGSQVGQEDEIINPFEQVIAPHSGDEDGDEQFLVEELLERSRNLIGYAQDAALTKKDLLASVKMLFEEYPQIDEGARAGINEQIMKDCKILGVVSLEMSEVERLWR